MTANYSSRWGMGVKWGATTSPFKAYWAEAEATTPVGKPVLAVFIGVPDAPVAYSPVTADWSLGRDDWMSVLAPTTATLTFVGDHSSIALNALVSISLMVDEDGDVISSGYYAGTPQPMLWLGRVDSVNLDRDVAGHYWTTVTATDPVSLLAEAKAPTSIAGGKIGTLITSLALGANVVVVVDGAPISPDLTADATVDDTILGYVNRMERSVNVALFMLGSGHLLFQQRVADAVVPSALSLTGANAPATWSTSKTIANIISQWHLTNEAGSWDFTYDDPTSMGLYGTRMYEVTDMLATSEAAYTDLIGGKFLGSPRKVVTSGVFPIDDMARLALYLDPLDYITDGVTTWQVMSVSHALSSGNVWTVTITADVTSGDLMG